MQRRKTGGVLRIAALAAIVAAAGCADSGDHLLVRTPPQGGALFERYVALGNSITAGMISSGLTAETQMQAYPVLLAQAAGAEFGVPLLVPGPGCPVPLAGPLTPSTEQPVCVRAVPAPRVVQNLAVPGVRIADLFRIPPGDLAGLHTLLVGHQTQAGAMISAQPTFVSAWIGNNDALLAAVSGVLGPHAAGAPPALTPLAEFQASVDQLAAAIRAAGPQGVMLVGVVDPVIAVPLLQPGAYFFAARDAQGRFQGVKPVNLNCSPVTALGQPNPLARNLVSFRVLADPNIPEINCDPAAYGGLHLLDTQEQAIVRQRVADYNAALAAAAATNGWLFVDPNLILGQYLMERDADGRYPWLRKCQDLATAATPAQLQAAVLNSCPVTGPTAAPTFFGTLMSHDGVHPSAAAHRILTSRFAAAINARHGTSLAAPAN
jgi:hypothetical protein